MMSNGAMNYSTSRLHQTDTGTHNFNRDGGMASEWRGENEMSDEEDDSWDDNGGTSSAAFSCRTEPDGVKDRRTERLNELLITEKEFVRDLEALLQVVKKRQTTVLHPSIMLGNTEEVVTVAQQLVQGLQEVLKGNEKEQQLGQLFLNFSKKLCQVYQEYCSHYSVHVLVLLKKYEESEEAEEELSRLGKDLHRIRPHLLSVNTALIKPVQRILRYPLYLDHLLEDTPSSHPDFPLLQEAHLHLNNTAIQINEYTRDLGLVSKYFSDDHHSLHAKMRRVSLHSLVKKSTRMSTLFSQRLGLMSQSACTELEEEEAKFYRIQSAVEALVNHTKSLLEAVRARHSSELLISLGLRNILHTPHVVAMKQAAMESYDQVFKAFESEVTLRVLNPVRELATLFEVPARLIQKRYLKKLDYDAAQAKQNVKNESNMKVHMKVCERDRVKMWEKQEKVKAYEGLQSLLLTELPLLNRNGQAMVITAFDSLAAACLYLQGRMARIYLLMAKVESLPYTSPKAAQEAAQKQMEWLLTLLPCSLQKKVINKDIPGTITIRKKTTAMKNGRKNLPAEYLEDFNPTLQTPTLHPSVQHKTSTFHVPLRHPESYKALYPYAAEDDTQLTLMPGQRVKPLLKDSYEQWWFVKADSGKQGYVPAAYLTPCLD